MSPAPYPILYSFRRCPYAMRARLALYTSGQVCEWREVVLAHKPAALLQASPKGTVPVLVQTNGQVLEQSLDIMMWALRQNDPHQWLPADGAPIEQTLHQVAQCDGEFKFNLDRYKYPGRFGLADGLLHRAQGAGFLNALNQSLNQQKYLSGARQGLADAAMAPFVRQFAHTDPVWFAAQPWPGLQSWLSEFENSIPFQRIMIRCAPWLPDHPLLLFPQPR